MSEKPSNPQAFPGGFPEAGYEPCYGMTLRDWFAGQALAGACTHYEVWREHTWEGTASWAYEMADAMLAERERGQ